ncbi:MAG: GyrI-like domain-containing protein [Clostridiales bacterium]|jgi:AraC family transcriptional regulator|nr:GyrI-like domain-containing protein [Clostridiales bacterium]
MVPKIVKFGPVKVAGYLHKTSMSNNTIPDFWGEIMSDGRQKILHEQDFVEHHREYGICVMTNEDDMDYIVAVETKPGAQIPEKYMVFELAEGDYAVFNVPVYPMSEPSPNIGLTWGKAAKWLETGEYTTDGNANFELYFPDCACTNDKICDLCNSGNMHCDIYIKVNKK